MNKTIFDGYLKASADQSHPNQMNLDFIFTDFHPNRNNQAVPKSEAENIITTGINQPIKANFAAGRVQGHTNATTVGPIIGLEQQGDRIIGHAILWKDDFPDLADYLVEASKKENGVQFSWEIYYKNARADTNGVSWLEGCYVAGAAIVADPAYAGRTHLLALAEERKMELEEMQKQLSEIQEKLWTMLDALYAAASLPGVVDRAAGVEAQFNEIINALKGMAEAKASLETELTQKNEQLTTKDTELAELRENKEKSDAEKARAELLSARKTQLKDVLPADEFDAKADFIAGLSDDQFKSYAESLSNVAQKAKASSGEYEGKVPEFGSGHDTPPPSRSELAKALRGLNK